MKQQNQEFKANHPQFTLPPDYLLYESFQLNYRLYYETGIETAEWLASHLKRYINLENAKILDWGCGPGRIVRHLPEFTGEKCEIYGTDYNRQSIVWCSRNLKSIKFNHNSLVAKLPYPDNYFDAIYGLSIFTHLSEQMHFEWAAELMRIIKPNGILFVTTQGEVYKTKLLEKERELFENGRIVVRGKVKEGHRTFSAFHPKEFMQSLFGEATVAEHIELEPSTQNPFPQDIWIIKK